MPNDAPPGPQPSVYPATLPQAPGELTFLLFPPIRICVLRDPAYPAVSTRLPKNSRSTLPLNC
jgi:hypothetical protein